MSMDDYVRWLLNIEKLDEKDKANDKQRAIDDAKVEVFRIAYEKDWFHSLDMSSEGRQSNSPERLEFPAELTWT